MVTTRLTAEVGGKARDARVREGKAAKKPAPRKKAFLETIVVTSKDTLKCSFQGIRLVLLSDYGNRAFADLQVREFDLDILDWASALRLDTTVWLSMDYFNMHNSHWEPLIEPWQFHVHVSKQHAPPSMLVDVFSKKRLDLNLSHAFIEYLMQMTAESAKPDRGIQKSEEYTPYILRNRTGHPIHIWLDTEGSGADANLEKLENGQEMPWRFDDWRSLRAETSVKRNKIGLQFSGVLWESVKNIPVDVEGQAYYVLRPKMQKVSHRLVVDITIDAKGVKYVTFRSALLVENRTLIPLEMIIVDIRGHGVCPSKRIDPGTQWPVPIDMCFHYKIRVRPLLPGAYASDSSGMGYAWCSTNLFWHDLREDAFKAITCNPFDDRSPPFHLQVFGKYRKGDALAK